MRKGQAEMMGLMVVVLILIIGGLFYLGFMARGDGSAEAQQIHVQSITANNLLHAIMKIKVCEDVNIEGAVTACVKGEQLCGQNACDFFESEVDGIVQAVSDDDYRFIIKEGENEVHSIGDCEFGINSENYPLDVDYTTYDVQMRLCKEESTDK